MERAILGITPRDKKRSIWIRADQGHKYHRNYLATKMQVDRTQLEGRIIDDTKGKTMKTEHFKLWVRE